MHKIGMTTNGETLIAMDEQDLAAIRVALGMLSAVFASPPVAGSAPVAADAQAPKAAPAIVAARVDGKKGKKATKGPAGRRAKAAECSRCGAPRATTPWPKAGTLCRECCRKRSLEKYYAKKGKKPAGAKVQPATAVAPAPEHKPAGGVDRVRAALKRIELREGLPTDPITHQTEKILTD
jgi:hypothetical protein